LATSRAGSSWTLQMDFTADAWRTQRVPTSVSAFLAAPNGLAGPEAHKPAPVAAILESPPPPPPPPPRRRFLSDPADVPVKAQTWRSPSEKAGRLNLWRTAVGRHFPNSGRVLRVAWTLEWMFTTQGFAFPTDAYLARKIGIPVNKIQSALTELERAGGIIRRSVFMRGKAQRRIWPSVEIVGGIPPTAGGMDTPRRGDRHTLHGGGTEYLAKTAASQNRISATQNAARRDAALRALANERKRGRDARADAAPLTSDGAPRSVPSGRRA
jgi:hypothetical protein